jgi:acid phosphatase type 7
VVAGTWYDVDLTSIITGNGTYTIKISSTSTNGADHASKEGISGSSPQLIVTLTS